MYIGIPGIGVILYLLFGVSRIVTVAPEWESRGLWDIGNTDKAQCEPGDSCALEGDFDQRAFNMIATTGDLICAHPIMKGCHLDVLYDGTQAYPDKPSAAFLWPAVISLVQAVSVVSLLMPCGCACHD